MLPNSLRLPAEWEPQTTVLFAFPRRAGDWGDHLERAARTLIAAANAVNEACPVLMIVADEALFDEYAADYQGATLRLPTDDCWVRDYGPISTFFEEETLVLNDFIFNGWGGKYEAARDNGVPQRLWRAEFPAAGYRAADHVLEGGAIDSDGAGTLLTTTRCLLNPNRNGWADRTAAEALFADYFGTTRTLWLKHGQLAGDDTDAHVDTLARFLDTRTIAYVQGTDPEDEHYAELGRMEEELKALRTARGTPYRLLPLPLPPAVRSADDGRRLPATYANFLICNGRLFLPTYFGAEAAAHPGSETDALAAERLREYGRYEVVPIDCRAFLEQHGSLHCLTMPVMAPPRSGERP